MTPLPALSDVIRETLTPELLEQIQQDGYTWSQGTAKAIILNALLLPLTEREQGLRAKLALAEGLVCDQQDYAVMLEAAEARVSALTAEREALRGVALYAVSALSFASGYMGNETEATKRVEQDCATVVRRLGELAGAPHAPTQEKP